MSSRYIFIAQNKVTLKVIQGYSEMSEALNFLESTV